MFIYMRFFFFFSKAKQGGQIGITHVGQFMEPLNPESSDDKEAAERYLDFHLGW